MDSCERNKEDIESDFSQEMRDWSGTIDINGNIIAFFYLLIRDHMVGGKVAHMVKQLIESDDDTFQYSNGWLAREAEFYVNKLMENKKPKED